MSMLFMRERREVSELSPREEEIWKKGFMTYIKRGIKEAVQQHLLEHHPEFMLNLNPKAPDYLKEAKFLDGKTLIDYVKEMPMEETERKADMIRFLEGLKPKIELIQHIKDGNKDKVVEILQDNPDFFNEPDFIYGRTLIYAVETQVKFSDEKIKAEDKEQENFASKTKADMIPLLKGLQKKMELIQRIKDDNEGKVRDILAKNPSFLTEPNFIYNTTLLDYVQTQVKFSDDTIKKNMTKLLADTVSENIEKPVEAPHM
jgi:hypothetical protein